jgi:hypothetical protein
MVCLIPKPNDISSWVNNCLGFFLATSCFVACVKRTDPPCSFQRSELSRCTSTLGVIDARARGLVVQTVMPQPSATS